MIKKRKSPAARGSTTTRKNISFDLNDANDLDIEEYEADFVIGQVDDDDIVITKEEVTVDSTIVTADGGDQKDLNMKLISAELPIIVQMLSSDIVCNYYTGFPSISRMQVVFDVLYARVNGENVILYQNCVNSYKTSP